MSEYFPEPKSSGGKVNAELGLFNYARKVDFLQVFDRSKFAEKVDLASLKSVADKLEKVPTGLNSLKNKVDELDVNKLVPVPVDLCKLSAAV